jgi:uroporphyrinogen decarboxylase
MNKMTSGERFLAAVNLQSPDRVPKELRFAPDLEARLKKDLNLEGHHAFEDWLGNDAVTIRPVYKNPASPVKYADPTIKVDGGLYYDIYHVPFRIVEGKIQKMVELAGIPPLPGEISMADIDKFAWPRTDEWDYSTIKAQCEEHRDKALWCRTRGCFLTAMFIRGEEQFLMDLLLEQDIAEAVLDRISDFIINDAQKTLQAGEGNYSFIEYGDDVATQKGMMISPELWRKILKPRLRLFSDMAKSFGVKLRYHSCGAIYPIIGDLIDIGVDILNPIQALAANMDPFKIKQEFGNKICLHGGLDIQALLPKGTIQEVKVQVKRLLDMGKNGGYILAGTHTLQNDIPTDNIAAIIETYHDVYT